MIGFLDYIKCPEITFYWELEYKKDLIKLYTGNPACIHTQPRFSLYNSTNLSLPIIIGTDLNHLLQF